MSALGDWLDPNRCPASPPPLAAMEADTRELHAALDAHAGRSGVPYLHPDEPTVQLDLLGSSRAIAWQEGKAAFLFSTDGCWAELPPLYARYGTTATGQLIARLKALEQASAVLVTDSGTQAAAVAFDVMLPPGGHAVLMRQVYNKTRSYLEWATGRLGATLTIVDDGDRAALEAAIRPETALVFAETFTNPLVRAQDIASLCSAISAARTRAPGIRLVIDSTIATPWAFPTPLLTQGVDVVIGSGTKALGGSDRDLWGYLATNEVPLANGAMDLMAMRGGILDWRRAQAVLAGWETAGPAHARRSATAGRLAAFLASHPKVSEVFHPSLPSHPDAEVIRRGYVRHGSLLSFRVRNADEERTRHVADVIAMTVVVRYALSFDGLASKVNHHATVSEYFTNKVQLARNGFDRLIRLGIGLEAPEDLMAALNWALHRADTVSAGEVEAWQCERAASLGVA